MSWSHPAGECRAVEDQDCSGLSNLLSGNSDFAGSRILAIPFDIGLALAGPLFVDFDEDCADEAQ